MLIGRSGLAPWLGCVLLLTVAGCGGGDGGPEGPGNGGAGSAGSGGAGPRLLFVTNSNSDWWNAVEKGMTDGGAEFGARVEMRRNDKETPGQIRILEDALSLPDVAGVAVSPYEAGAPGIADLLRELRDAGKVVIAIDSDVSPEYADVRRAYIGTNNAKAGEVAGRAAATLKPEGGEVCMFVGTSSASNARDRIEGFFKGAGPAFKRTEVFDDGANFAKASTNVQTALSKFKDLDLLVGIYSYNGPRIAEEVAAAPDVRKNVKVVSFDLDELAVGHLERGNIDASVCQNPYEMGYQGVRLLKAYLDKDEAAVKAVLPDGKSLDTGVRVIVPKADSPVFRNKEQGDDVITVDEMKSWMAGKGLKSS